MPAASVSVPGSTPAVVHSRGGRGASSTCTKNIVEPYISIRSPGCAYAGGERLGPGVDGARRRPGCPAGSPVCRGRRGGAPCRRPRAATTRRGSSRPPAISSHPVPDPVAGAQVVQRVALAGRVVVEDVLAGEPWRPRRSWSDVPAGARAPRPPARAGAPRAASGRPPGWTAACRTARGSPRRRSRSVSSVDLRRRAACRCRRGWPGAAARASRRTPAGTGPTPLTQTPAMERPARSIHQLARTTSTRSPHHTASASTSAQPGRGSDIVCAPARAGHDRPVGRGQHALGAARADVDAEQQLGGR